MTDTAHQRALHLMCQCSSFGIVGPVERLDVLPAAGGLRGFFLLSRLLLELLQPVVFFCGHAVEWLAECVVSEVVGGERTAPSGVVPSARRFFSEGNELGVVRDGASAPLLVDELVAAVRRLAVDISVNIGIVGHGLAPFILARPRPGCLAISSRRRSRRSAPWWPAGSWNKKHDRRLLD